MLILFIMIMASLGFGETKLPRLSPDKYEEIKDDRIFLDILSQEFDSEEDKIMRNKVILKNLEMDLDLTIKHGIVEKEFCIRQGITPLRTIDYVYNWVLKQIKNVKYDEVKLSSMQTLDRIRHLNKLFADRTLKIEECKLKISAKSRSLKNEMFSDRVETSSDILKTDLKIPEDYPAARAPFR